MVRLMVMYVRSTDRALDAIAWWPLLMTTAINLRASADPVQWFPWQQQQEKQLPLWPPAKNKATSTWPREKRLDKMSGLELSDSWHM